MTYRTLAAAAVGLALLVPTASASASDDVLICDKGALNCPWYALDRGLDAAGTVQDEIDDRVPRLVDIDWPDLVQRCYYGTPFGNPLCLP
jgi:hypothetical protein